MNTGPQLAEPLEGRGGQRPTLPLRDRQAAVRQPLIALLPARDLHRQVAAHHKHQFSPGPARPGPFQGANGEWIAQRLGELQPWIVDLLHQGLEQFRPQGQWGTVLFFGVVARPGGHLRV